MSKPILFFGNERLATGVTTQLPVIKALLAAGYDIKAVVLANRGKPANIAKSPELEIRRFAQKNNLMVADQSDLARAKSEPGNLGAEAAVLVAYGRIVPAKIIALFPGGIINLHPSLLPRHRGPTPIESVILGGEAKTGVSLMQLTPKMDSGPLYAQAEVEVPESATKQGLADQLGQLGAKLLSDNLPAILTGQLLPTSQNEALATYDQLIVKADGLIDWSRPAQVVERQVRAYAVWPRSTTTINDQTVVLTAVRVVNKTGQPGQLWRHNRQFGFYAGQGAIQIDKLIPAGRPEMTAQAFLAGWR